MTIRSFSPGPDHSGIPHDNATPPPLPFDGGPAGETTGEMPPVPPAPPSPQGPARTGTGAQDEYTDPVHGLVHAAVADRPLEEVLQLITLLEQSPTYARATIDALRAVGVDRSVEDVTRLVSLLTRPPRNADCADEAIRAAAESRPVEDVTRLMALLHRPPLEPHCGEEAVRAAASRPVEELVQLIGRLAEERDTSVSVPEAVTGRSAAPVPMAPGRLPADLRESRRPSGRRTAGRRRTRRTAPPAWPGLIAAAALMMCGLSYFPLHRGGASDTAYGFALGVSILCILLAPALILHSSLPVLALCTVVPAALAAVQLLDGRFRSPSLSRALQITAAPAWFAGLAAVLAALAALTALLALFAQQRFGRPQPQPGQPDQPDYLPLTGANHTPQ